MPTLEAIEHEIENILAVADELPEGQEEIALEYLDELALQETDKADAIAYVIRKRQSEVQFLKDEEVRIRSRRKAIENRLQSFKEYLAGVFQRENITKLQALKSTLYLRHSTSVEVMDINSLPADLVKTEVSFVPRKKEIKEKIKSGTDVPGAVIKEKQTLCVK